VSDGTVLFTGVGPNNATFPQISCVPSGGTCSKTWTPTVAGQWQISAYWSGDAQYPNPVITNIQLTVSSSSTGLTVTAQPSSVTAGHLDQLTAQLSGSATGGTIQFSGVGPNNQAFTASPSSCAPTTGSCSIFWTAPANGAGTWHITANWTGPNGQTGTGTTSVTVNAPGFLTVNETPNPLQVSHTGTVTATVQTASSGLVTFTGSGPNGQSYTASCTLNNSLTCTASPAFTPTTVGTWTIGASFFTAGNDYTDSTLVEVTGTPTTLTLTAAPNPPTVGQATTLTASISPSVSDGSVVFSGVGPSGQSFVVNPSSCTPSAGSCPVTWTPTATGSWTITASWSGDSTHAPSSNQITVTVSTGNLSISSDPASPIAGSSATLTATLAFNTSSASTIAWSGTGPSGQSLTQFVSQPTCPITTGGNQCSVTWTPDAPGNWTIKATWSGDSTHQNGDTATVTITVGSAFFTVTLSPSPPETLNSTVIATAKIADTSVNDGEVDFYFTKPDNTTVVETCPQPQQGTCSSDPVTLDQSGQWTLLTVWNGDTQYPAGATSSITFNVS
jgi:hypothetical protein